MWKLVLTVPNGHRYFSSKDGRIAVADDSGETPDVTDDGVCWIDGGRPILLDLPGGVVSVPIILGDVRPSRTVDPLQHAAEIVAVTNLQAHVSGTSTQCLFAKALNGLRRQ